MPITISEIRDTLRAEAVSLALGALLIVAGMVAIAVAALVRRRMAATLYLGGFAFLYGLRLLARTDIFRVAVGFSNLFWESLAATITYVIIIPAILFSRAIEPGWRRLWNWLLVGLVVFAAYAITSDAIVGEPNSARVANNFIAIAFILGLAGRFFRPGLPRTRELRTLRLGIGAVSVAALADNLRGIDVLPFPGPDLEPFGFTVAIACLGTLLAQRMFSDARRLVALDRELSLAREIQYSILPQGTPRLQGIAVAARYRPMTSVAGDFYDFIQLDEHRIGVLVADVSGHGVPAALIASMVKVALAAQHGCAEQPAEVLAGMNRALVGRLASRYVTAAYVFIDGDRKLFRYAAAGHPPMLRAARDGEAHEIEQNGLLLGFLDEVSYTTYEQPFDVGDRLLLYTDGLVEAGNREGDFYGLERVKASLLDASALSTDQATDAVLQAMESWSGVVASDDLTLVLIERKANPDRVRMTDSIRSPITAPTQTGSARTR